MSLTIASPQRLDEAQRFAVLELAAAIEKADGAPPLSDQARTQLGAADVRHLVATDNGRLAGYAQLSATSAELLGEPATLEPLFDALPTTGPGLDLWAHGTHSRLIPLLDQRGLPRERVLLQLRWPVAPLPRLVAPAGVTLRPFVVGQDEDAWLAVNAAAFAHHPEQGGWTAADLAAREAEPWFDPFGFVLAVQDDVLVGFHWTKRHSATLGEVYVIAVAPAAQGRGLSPVLLTAGLQYLSDGGVSEVSLYVDESNSRALALYEKNGFRRFDQDVQYRLHPAR